MTFVSLPPFCLLFNLCNQRLINNYHVIGENTQTHTQKISIGAIEHAIQMAPSKERQTIWDGGSMGNSSKQKKERMERRKREWACAVHQNTYGREPTFCVRKSKVNKMNAINQRIYLLERGSIRLLWTDAKPYNYGHFYWPPKSYFISLFLIPSPIGLMMPLIFVSFRWVHFSSFNSLSLYLFLFPFLSLSHHSFQFSRLPYFHSRSHPSKFEGHFSMGTKWN